MKTADIIVIFSQNMRKIRLQQEISQEEVSFRTGLSKNYISDVERGTRNISLRNVQKIAEALNIKIVDLFN